MTFLRGPDLPAGSFEQSYYFFYVNTRPFSWEPNCHHKKRNNHYDYSFCEVPTRPACRQAGSNSHTIFFT